MSSRHVTGHAVDLVAYTAPLRISWELPLYIAIATAMREAAIQAQVTIRWGAAWNIPDITQWDQNMEAAMNHYIDARRKLGKTPFIDAPHFEIPGPAT